MGQVAELSIEMLTRQFRDFEYSRVIQLSDRILAQNLVLSTSEEIEIRRMRAISFYSLDDIQSCLIESLEILKIDKDYQLDPVQNPPKIVSFFNEVKANFVRSVPLPADTVQVPVDSLNLILRGFDRGEKTTRAAILRSALLPGWGQLQRGYSTRGWLLIAASAGLAGSSIWAWRHTVSKERAYLNAVRQPQIQSTYSDYNDAYRLRNLLLSASAAVWLYAQLDLFYWSRPKHSMPAVIVAPLASDPESIRVALRWQF